MANSNGAASPPPSPTPPTTDRAPRENRVMSEPPTVEACARDRANGETSQRDQLRAAYGLPLGQPRG